MMKKSFWGIVTLLALAIQSAAQDVYKNNFDLTFGGGLHTNLINIAEGGKNDPRFGWNFNANYRHMFGYHFGLGTGLGLGYYKSKLTFDDLLITNTLTHPHNGRTYENKAQFSDWVESQRLIDLEIPVTIYFMGYINNEWDFISGIGGKLMLPFWNSYHVNDGDLEVKGYFEDFTNIEYYDLPKHGFTKYHNYYGKSDINTITGAAFADAGFLYKMKGNCSLYLGAYFSYSFLNLAKKHDNKLYDGKAYTGIASSNLVDESALLAAGVKLGLSFGYPKIKEDSVIYGHPIAVYPYNDPELPEDKVRTEPTEEEREALRMIKIKKMREDSIQKELEKVRQIEKEKAQIEQVNASVKWLSSHLKVIFYDTKGAVELNVDNDEHIRILTEFINSHPDKVVKVTGYSCNLNREEFNVAIALKRAVAVKEMLMESGIPEKNIKVESRGSKYPIAPNNTEANRQKNRRVKLSIE